MSLEHQPVANSPIWAIYTIKHVHKLRNVFLLVHKACKQVIATDVSFACGQPTDHKIQILLQIIMLTLSLNTVILTLFYMAGTMGMNDSPETADNSISTEIYIIIVTKIA